MKPLTIFAGCLLTVWFVAVGLTHAQPISGGDTPPVIATGATARLTYAEDVTKDPEPVKGGDGLKGPIEKLAREMNQPTAPAQKAEAKLVLSINPKLQLPPKQNQNQPAKVTLEFREETWDVDSNISSDHQLQLAGEHGGIMDQLGTWQVTLSPDQRAALEAGRKLSFAVVPPFSSLALLSRPDVTVSVKLGGVDSGSATAVTVEEGP